LKKLLYIFLAFLSISSFAQVGTGSPYSFVGFGETNFRGNHLNRAMGGIDVYIDSIHPNINNPASYGKLKATTYSVGVNYRSNILANNSDTQKVTTSAIDYIGVSVPTKRFGFGFGILPFSSVGYLLEEISQTNQINAINRFTGEGGINNAFFKYRIQSNERSEYWFFS
jgi:long-subunit fatty acid transport protein